MGSDRFFDYYYGRESEQFTFFRIPKLLIRDSYFSSLCAESKLLYGLLLDRMNLSRMNAWYDDMGRVYIMYPVREIQNDLCIGKNTACKLFKQLESVGLIERVRRGLGLPDLIYVKNFASGERPGEPEYDLGDPSATSASDSASEGSSGKEPSGISYFGFSVVRDEKNGDYRNEEETLSMESCRNVKIGYENENTGRNNSYSGKRCTDGNPDEPVETDNAEETVGKRNCDRTNKDMPVTQISGSNKSAEIPTSSCKDVLKTVVCHGDSQNKPSVSGSLNHGTPVPRGMEGKPLPSGSLRNKPLPRSLRNKPLDRSLKSKLLGSQDIKSKKFKNQTPGGTEFGTLRNNTEKNNNYSNNSSSSLSRIQREPGSEERGIETVSGLVFDQSDYSAGLSYPELLEAVKDEIEYDALVSDYGEGEVSIFPQLIAEMLYKCREKQQIVIGSHTYQSEILKERYLKIGMQHIRHVLLLMQEEHIAPRCIRNYYIQVLYDAPATMDAYYSRRVDHDMHWNGLLVAGA